MTVDGDGELGVFGDVFESLNAFFGSCIRKVDAFDVCLILLIIVGSANSAQIEGLVQWQLIVVYDGGIFCVRVFVVHVIWRKG